MHTAVGWGWCAPGRSLHREDNLVAFQMVEVVALQLLQVSFRALMAGVMPGQNTVLSACAVRGHAMLC